MCKVMAGQNRDWMYVSRLDPSFLHNVLSKFIPAAQRHRMTLDRSVMNCPCNKCQNKKCLPDDDVLSHLIQYGFIKDPKYTVWKYHGEQQGARATAATVVSLGPADAHRRRWPWTF